MTFTCDYIRQIALTNDSFTIRSSFLKPVHIVMAACVERYTDRKVRFEHQSDYARMMRYHDPLDIDTTDSSSHQKAIVLKPYFDNDQQVRKVMHILQTCSHLDTQTLGTLQTIVAELFQNFYAHAEEESPPICCVQDWPTSDYLEIAIADKGIGIPASLQEVLTKDDENPCRTACLNGVSSKLGKNHSGYGLYFTKRFMEENRGMLYLVSDRHCYENQAGSEKDHLLEYRWKGTVVRLILNKHHSIDPEQFFQTMAKEQGDYDDFF